MTDGDPEGRGEVFRVLKMLFQNFGMAQIDPPADQQLGRIDIDAQSALRVQQRGGQAGEEAADAGLFLQRGPAAPLGQDQKSLIAQNFLFFLRREQPFLNGGQITDLRRVGHGQIAAKEGNAL